MMARIWQQQTNDAVEFANASAGALVPPTSADQLAIAPPVLTLPPSPPTRTANSLFFCTWGCSEPLDCIWAAANDSLLLTTKTAGL